MNIRPTIMDVAKHSGFSKSTVSLALGHSSEIPASTRGTVLAVAKKLGYRPNRLARSLRTTTSQMIGIIIQDSLNPFYADVVRRIEKKLLEHKYEIVVSETNQDLLRERDILEQMGERQVDGIIISSMNYSKISDLLLDYESRNIHCVVAGPPDDEDIPFDCVSVNLSKATATAMEYLIELGHSNLAFVCGAPPWQGLGGRLSAFKEKLEQHGLTLHEGFICHCGFNLKDGYEAGKHLLSMFPRPTAIFAINDLLAIGVMRAAKDLGIEVPRDVSVVGVDNVELASYIQPSLSTVAQPIDKFANALSELMLKGLTKKKSFHPARVELTSSFLIRESTGPAPQKAIL